MQLWNIFKAFVETDKRMKLKLNELLFNGHFQSQNLCVYNMTTANVIKPFNDTVHVLQEMAIVDNFLINKMYCKLLLNQAKLTIIVSK